MKAFPKPLALCLAVCALLLILGALIWRWERASADRAAAAVRQFNQLQEKLARYAAARRIVRTARGADESLFASLNRIAVQAVAQGRLDNLRPVEDRQGEAIEMQLHGLYLAEAMRLISLVEGLEATKIERMTLRQNQDSLLDLDLRVKRYAAKK